MTHGFLLIYLLVGTVSLQVHTFTAPKRASLSYFKRAEQPSPHPFLDSSLTEDLEKRASLSYFKRAIPPLKRASLSYFKRGHSAFDGEEDLEQPYYVYNVGVLPESESEMEERRPVHQTQHHHPHLEMD
ncbi:hypothetical protein T265_14477 [Opisthorchis viverrini]|uniref:Uncharacterized protein n=1 Tax=Opisthorchis viverrini TaxID=6198 RepID=A0A074ZAR2_OPIVI|nr:hypothetical protein T265_14477 [Opisthorchis viverrini]KER24178.1 hypothetical protein T265_14477 [Opisthorchis viverrini]